MLVDEDAHQRETITKWPIWLALINRRNIMATFTSFDLKHHTFFALKSIFRVLPQLFRALGSFCRATWLSMEDIVLYNLASLAKWAMRVSGETQNGMPSMKIAKSKGPRIEPYGTPDVTGNKSERMRTIDDDSLHSALQKIVQPDQ